LIGDAAPKKPGTVMSSPNQARSHAWPELPYSAWSDTCTTLHLWTQIVGKIRLVQTPWINHSWHVTLYVTARGLTTSPIPYRTRSFEIEFDFIDHRIVIRSSDGGQSGFALEPQTVADFYRRMMDELTRLMLPVAINKLPNEIPEPIPFDQDDTHRSYDAEYANRFWRVLLQSDRIFKIFRARFAGKCSPVHFFWGAPDLAVTRFSGRSAPQHPGGIPHLPDRITREAYSFEVSSAGFWAGGPGADACFYSYAYPEPEGFSTSPVRPAAAFYSKEMKEFFLPYNAVSKAESPDEMLLDFLQTTYEAAAKSGHWNRSLLERQDDSD